MKTGDAIKALAEGKYLTDGRYVFKINIYNNLARCLKGSNDWEKIDYSVLSGLNLSVYSKEAFTDKPINTTLSKLKTAWNNNVADDSIDFERADEDPSFDAFLNDLED